LIAAAAQFASLSAHTSESGLTSGGAQGRLPVPHDWSHRHLIYSAPRSIHEAHRLQQEPRYWHQWVRRHGAGAFDNAYINSANGTGYLFVCGKDGNRTDRPAIHRITITNGVMSNGSDGFLTLVRGSFEECSPVTEVYNTATSTDWIFFSVGLKANQTAAGCSTNTGTTGCLMSLNVTALAGAWPPASVSVGYPLPDAPAGGAGNTAATSGIVIDNVANATTYAQASSLYFSFISNAVTGAACNGATGVGCGVKLTQSALQ